MGDSGVGLLNAAIGLGGLVGALGALGLTGGPGLTGSSRSRSRPGGLPLMLIGAWPVAALAVARSSSPG